MHSFIVQDNHVYAINVHETHDKRVLELSPVTTTKVEQDARTKLQIGKG